jgi:hypothetical protein
MAMKVMYAAGVLMPLVVAHAALAATPKPQVATTCNVMVDVTDSDPKGLNVRAAPGGNVLTALVDHGDWMELHVTGELGDWYAIDRAEQINNDNPDEGGVVWRGNGYVHRKTVGLSGLQQGATLYADHSEKSRAVVKNADGDQATELLGCSGNFYKVHIKKGTGWTKQVCTNENTTCS